MEIVDDAYLIERFGLSKHFIAEHAPKWGAFSRPRKHILEEVERYLAALSQAKRDKYANIEIRKHANKQMVKSIVDEVFAKRALRQRTALVDQKKTQASPRTK